MFVLLGFREHTLWDGVGKHWGEGGQTFLDHYFGAQNILDPYWGCGQTIFTHLTDLLGGYGYIFQK